MKKISFFLLALLTLPNLTLAAEFRGGDVVNITETLNDDSYIGGEEVRVSEGVNVEGDLLIGGAKTNAEGTVAGDLNIVSGDVWVSGEVEDDLRVGGGNIRIDATVKDDALIGGGSVDISSDSQIGGDLVFGAGQMNLAGKVGGNVRGGGGNIYINAIVEGNVNLYQFDRLTFGPNARIRGDLAYRSREALQNIPPNAVEGEIQHTQTTQKPDKGQSSAWAAAVAGFSLYDLLCTLFFGLFLLWIFPRFSPRLSTVVEDNSLKSFGLGLLVLLGGPILLLLLMITLIGIPAALFLFGLWLLLIYLAKISAALLIGNKIVPVTQDSALLRQYGSFALGAVIYTLLGLIPWVGFAIKLVLALMALGGLALYHWTKPESREIPKAESMKAPPARTAKTSAARKKK